MFVIGGRSTTTEFKDMFALDTEVDPPVWTEVSVFDHIESTPCAQSSSFGACLTMSVSVDLEAPLHATS